MPKRKQIEAKPTIYKGVKFRSRLEARWAVFFENTSLVPAWRFEPKTFKLPEKGWDYLPDFMFKFGGYSFYLEVKPVIPTLEYLKVLDQFAAIMPTSLMLGVGDFYKGIYKKGKSKDRFGIAPSIYLLKDATTQDRIISECIPIYEYFQGSRDAVDAVKAYRFDLPEKRKARKFTKGPLEHFAEYRTKEAKKSREKSKQVDWKAWHKKRKK